MTVSVIIPTLGRARLASALRSVRMQGEDVEVLIVNDSGVPLDCGQLDPDVVIIETTGLQGAAAARNAGLEKASGDFIAFLDDDDEWLRDHLSDALKLLAERPDVDIYSCRSLVVDETGQGRIEPVELLQQGPIWRHLFGPGTWYARSRRLPTPTLVFRQRLAAHRHDVSLLRRQDTWWLLTAERDMGARLFQSAHIGVVVYADRVRHDRIDSFADHVSWAQRLDTIRPGCGASQVISRGRQAARAGEVASFPDFSRELHRLRDGRRRIPILWGQRLAAHGIRAKRRLQRQ